jgi:hypothetical protein
MGGPGWQDFVIEQPEHSPHFRYDLANQRRPEDLAPLHLPLHRALADAALAHRARLRRPVDARRQTQRKPLAVAGAGAAQQRLRRLVQASRFAARVQQEQGRPTLAGRARALALGRTPVRATRAPAGRVCRAARVGERSAGCSSTSTSSPSSTDPACHAKNDSPFHRSAASWPFAPRLPLAVRRRPRRSRAAAMLGGTVFAEGAGPRRCRCITPPRQTRRAAVHGRRGEPHRPLRLQTRADQAPRPAERLRRAVEAFQNGLGPWLKPVWDFKPYGQCGKMLSEVGRAARRVRRRHRLRAQHGRQVRRALAGTLLQTTGFQLPGFPGMGCWVSYGLGSLNDNLPTFVVLPDHRGCLNGVKNWDAAFLPSQHRARSSIPARRRRSPT